MSRPSQPKRRGISLADLSPALRAQAEAYLTRNPMEKTARRKFQDLKRKAKSKGTPHTGPESWSFHISGQVRGGKNNMGISSTGRHYAKPEWAAWRDAAVAEVRAQLPPGWQPITVPVNVQLDYVAENLHRRDCPAIIDAVWHVLEKAGVVADDTLLWPTIMSRRYDKLTAGIKITKL